MHTRVRDAWIRGTNKASSTRWRHEHDGTRTLDQDKTGGSCCALINLPWTATRWLHAGSWSCDLPFSYLFVQVEARRWQLGRVEQLGAVRRCSGGGGVDGAVVQRLKGRGTERVLRCNVRHSVSLQVVVVGVTIGVNVVVIVIAAAWAR